VALALGLRPGEALGLRWSDVDLDAGVLHVRQQLQRVKGKGLVATPPKSEAGKRWMNLLAPLLAPVFAWNHDQVMAEGGRGLARHLGVTLRSYTGTRAA